MKCGARSAKPQDWKLSRYPECNRPHGHGGLHREYRRNSAYVVYEWHEPLVLNDTALRRYWASHNKARSQ
jgi:hypothetical protein